MGCPLWEESPRKAKSKSRPIVRQRQPLTSDYGVSQARPPMARPPIRRRALPRDTPYFVAAVTPREPSAYTATRSRIRQDRIVRHTLESLFASRRDELAPAARENAHSGQGENDNTLPPIRTTPSSREQNSFLGREGIRSLLRFQDGNRDQESDQRLQPLDGFLDALAEWNGNDGGREARAQLETQLNSMWPFPPNGDAYRAGDDAGAGRYSGRRLDLSPAVPSSGDARREFAESARRFHQMVVQAEYRHRDAAYRQLLTNQSAIAFRALRDFNSGLITLEQAERPIEVYRELLRLGPDHMEPAIPPRNLPRPATADSGDEQGTRLQEDVPTPIISRAESGIVGLIDGLGDRNRSLSPEGDNWDTLRSTLTPDPLPPSVGSSFASLPVSQNTGSTSQSTDITRMSDLFADHDGDHECDGSCLFCPEHYLGDDDDDISDVDPDLEREAEAELRERWRETNRQARYMHEMMRRERAARVSGLAARFNLDRVEP